MINIYRKVNYIKIISKLKNAAINPAETLISDSDPLVVGGSISCHLIPQLTTPTSSLQYWWWKASESGDESLKFASPEHIGGARSIEHHKARYTFGDSLRQTGPTFICGRQGRPSYHFSKDRGKRGHGLGLPDWVSVPWDIIWPFELQSNTRKNQCSRMDQCVPGISITHAFS